MVKKHKIALFINSGTKASPTWVRIKKSTQLKLAMNPTTTDYDYIADENPTTELESYKPSIDQDLTMYETEPDYTMIWDYFYDLKVGTDAHIEAMIVFMHESGTATGSYKTWKTDAVISVQDMDAVASKLNFQILFGGTIAKGTATIAEGVPTFTETVAEA